jgi:hypothetical protein
MASSFIETYINNNDAGITEIEMTGQGLANGTQFSI